jgi:hypothetical protein
MGSSISTLRVAFQSFNATFQSQLHLLGLIQQSPGLPVPNPSVSFWSLPASPIADHRSPWVQHVDVVVIGSGITGTSVARTILTHQGGGDPVDVLMLEARQACSGATGRYVWSIPLGKGYSYTKSIIKKWRTHLSCTLP